LVKKGESLADSRIPVEKGILQAAFSARKWHYLEYFAECALSDYLQKLKRIKRVR
jgi:hypothetical protein